ncbi:MAG: lipopolysaccharide kinase InaA family protein, partial [Gemmatimonadaceae bacterium]
MSITIAVPGYARLRVGTVRGLVVQGSRQSLESILQQESLYEHAARQPAARQFQGRAIAYAITLADGSGDVVVRHSMRGGLLGKTGSDLFLPPTRGLREVMNAVRLTAAGVPTPEVVAFVSYPVGGIFRRSDVATREIANSHDLATVLRKPDEPGAMDSCLRAAGRLLALMARAGAHHPDLNARNVLITWDGERGATAHVLDVDRIRFHVPGDPMVGDANMKRLERSLLKLRDTEELAVTP